MLVALGGVQCEKHIFMLGVVNPSPSVPLCSSRWSPSSWMLQAKNIISFFPLQNKETYEPLCKVPLMTSSKEEQKLIATSNKVSDVVFLHNVLTEISY